MASAPELNIEVKRSDTKQLQVTIVDNAGAVVNLTGATSVRWWWSKKLANGGFSPTQVFQRSLGSGITLVSPSTGRLDIDFDRTQTRDLTPGDYYHELEVIDLAGRVQTVLQGTVTLEKDLIVNP